MWEAPPISPNRPPPRALPAHPPARSRCGGRPPQTMYLRTTLSAYGSSVRSSQPCMSPVMPACLISHFFTCLSSCHTLVPPGKVLRPHVYAESAILRSLPSGQHGNEAPRTPFFCFVLDFTGMQRGHDCCRSWCYGSSTRPRWPFRCKRCTYLLWRAETSRSRQSRSQGEL